MPTTRDAAPPTMILLPGGLCVSGVAMWAVRLASSLVESGTPVSLVLFASQPDQKPLNIPIDPRVGIVDLAHLAPIESCQGELSAYLPAINAELDRLGASGVVSLLPNQHGDCYGLAASIATSRGDAVRVIGTAHSDNAYDLRLLEHYEPMLAQMVCVSDTLTSKAKSALPSRAWDIANIPYGVPIPQHTPQRPPLAERPIKLLYSGRFEHRQKRIMALPELARLLEMIGIDYTLTIIGEGPAKQDLEHACGSFANITILPAMTQQELKQQLATHDAMVLPSRYEGLSISMLEALALGCIPIVTRSESGTEQAITHGHTGMIADVLPDADELAAANGLAACIKLLLKRDADEIASNAALSAKERFSLESHITAWSKLLATAATRPARWWPATRPSAFTGRAGQSGSVPAAGASNMRMKLSELSGRPIIIHGSGQHTLTLAPLLADADVRAVADDDPARFGEKLLGWRIIDPESAASTGATDVVISSAMHEEAIWNRRDVYLEQGLRVHRLYAAAIPRAADAATSP
ncbi:MAG: glycosyltransferase family 4 protein [Phycisphaerales bacterium JB061]